MNYLHVQIHRLSVCPKLKKYWNSQTDLETAEQQTSYCEGWLLIQLVFRFAAPLFPSPVSVSLQVRQWGRGWPLPWSTPPVPRVHSQCQIILRYAKLIVLPFSHAAPSVFFLPHPPAWVPVRSLLQCLAASVCFSSFFHCCLLKPLKPVHYFGIFY